MQKNHIKRKRFWVQQTGKTLMDTYGNLWKDTHTKTLMERHSYKQFQVLIKELKRFDHEFFFKQFHISPVTAEFVTKHA